MATMTVTEVRRKLRDRDTYFDYADLSGLDLNNLDMSGISAYHANFRGCNCEGVQFEGAALGSADFTGANLRYASFTNADVSCVHFNQADLAAVNFLHARLKHTRFVDSRNMPVTDHTLIGSLLLATANDDIVKLAIASMVMVNHDFCWSDFAVMFLDNPMFSTYAIREWVSQTFQPYPSLAGKLAEILAWAERRKARIAAQEMRERYERE